MTLLRKALLGIASTLAVTAGLFATATPVQAADRCQGIYVEPGGTLDRGQSFSDGTLQLVHQGTDGNVVVYEDGTPRWDVGRSGRATTNFSVQGDANVVLYNGAEVVWASNTQDLQDGYGLIVYGSQCGFGRVVVGVGFYDGGSNSFVVVREL